MKTNFWKRRVVSAVALGAAAFLAGSATVQAAWGERSSSMDRSRGEQAVGEKVNLNTASMEELARVPGVGYERAKAIVDYRDSNGPLYWVDQVLNVKGIGPTELSAFRENVTVW